MAPSQPFGASSPFLPSSRSSSLPARPKRSRLGSRCHSIAAQRATSQFRDICTVSGPNWAFPSIQLTWRDTWLSPCLAHTASLQRAHSLREGDRQSCDLVAFSVTWWPGPWPPENTGSPNQPTPCLGKWPLEVFLLRRVSPHGGRRLPRGCRLGGLKSSGYLGIYSIRLPVEDYRSEGRGDTGEDLTVLQTAEH